MTGARQIQLKLFGRSSRLAGPRTLENGWAVADLARPVALSRDSQVIDISHVTLVSRDLLQDQAASLQLLSVGHHPLPVVEKQSTMEPVTCASTNLGHLIQGAVA